MPRQRGSLIPQSPVSLRILRLGLLFSSIGWGISFLFTFAPWGIAADQLYLMGADRIPYQPLLDYWLKMASATFGCIGIASALACLRPPSFVSLICLLGPFHLFIGTVLVVAAITNDLNADQHPTFPADITFCFVTAALISIPLLVARSRGNGSIEPDTLKGTSVKTANRQRKRAVMRKRLPSRLKRKPDGAASPSPST